MSAAPDPMEGFARLIARVSGAPALPLLRPNLPPAFDGTMLPVEEVTAPPPAAISFEPTPAARPAAHPIASAPPARAPTANRDAQPPLPPATIIRPAPAAPTPPAPARDRPEYGDTPPEPRHRQPPLPPPPAAPAMLRPAPLPATPAPPLAPAPPQAPAAATPRMAALPDPMPPAAAPPADLAPDRVIIEIGRIELAPPAPRTVQSPQSPERQRAVTLASYRADRREGRR